MIIKAHVAIIGSNQEDIKMTKKSMVTMTEGRIMPIILLFSIPLILGNLLQQMYNTADSIIVGNYVGSSALAAVGASTALINLLIAFSQGAAVGAGVVVSQFIGARDPNNTEKAVHTAICISLIIGVVLSIIGFFFSKNIGYSLFRVCRTT